MRLRGTTSTPGWFAAVLLVALTGISSADDLWDRALDVAEANQDWFASSVVIETQQLNSRGRVVDEGTTSVTRSISRNGRIQESVSESGGSPPDHENLLAGGLGLPVSLRSGGGALAMFARNRQGDLTLSRASSTATLDGGIEAVVYEYSQPSSDGSMMRGRVWVDTTSGVPVQVETIPEELPQPLVSSVSLIHFEPSATSWYPVRLEMTGVGRRMMIERQVHTIVTIGDYSRYRD